LQEILEILKVLSDEVRLKIVYLLSKNELCVCELMEALNMSQSRISNHLRILRDTKIIKSKREGKWIFYSLAKNTIDKGVKDIIGAIVEKIDEEGYLSREKNIIEKLILLRGTPGHCPLPAIKEHV